MRWILVGLLSCMVGPAFAQTASQQSVVVQAVDEVIRPGFAGLAEAAQAMAQDAETLCAEPSISALDAAQAGFATLVRQWSAVEWIRIGPLVQDNRLERIYFWPDRKGIALRQVQQILASSDAAATDPAQLATKSVAVQGLGALEFVLYGAGSEDLSTASGDFRCRYGQAVAERIAATTAEVDAGWRAADGIAGDLIDPDPANADYRTSTEALEELVGLVSHGIEGVRDTRLNPFLGSSGSAAKPKQAPFWRSGLTTASLQSNLHGLQSLVLDSGMASMASTSADLQRSVAFEFRNAERAFAVITQPVEAAVSDPAQLQAFHYLQIVTQDLQVVVGEQLPAALGLSVGFSALDGD